MTCGRFFQSFSTLALAALCVGASGAETAHPHAHWSYSGNTDPAHWAALEHEFETCGSGKHQSPIDIPKSAVHENHLAGITFAYQAAPLHIIDNGHTIQVNYPPGSFIRVGEHRYQLVQFHFHHPSEERIDGKVFDMVAHLVHKDDAGKLAVVAVLLTTGSANALLQTIFGNLPRQREKESELENVRIDAADLLPANHSYYHFEGSLTTPPCSEGVSWFVLRNPATLSGEQVKRFAQRYPMNARPVQPLDDREIDAGG